MTDELLDELPEEMQDLLKPVGEPPSTSFPGSGSDDEDIDVEGFLEGAGLTQDGCDIDLSKPWMKHHKFELVKSWERVRELVDRALEVGSVALDLETEGFDNRINYDAQGTPSTVHKIVGYCLGLEGQGYYVPVRHRYEALYGSSPNADDIEAVEREITRLCQAAQPVISEEGKKTDPLSSKDWSQPPKVTIEFWHAKFDQEFLYPVTGIDWWHPESFEDGMLANYVIYTDDDHGLKENSERKIPLADGQHPYTMIKFEHLFPKGMKRKEMRFYNLSPDVKGNGWNTVLYGCSDGICTNLLTKVLVEKVKADKSFTATYRIEKQVAQAVRWVERYRVLIDKAEIQNLLQEAEQELALYEGKIVQVARLSGFENFNPASAAQLAEFLFGDKGLNLKPKPELTAEGQFKTDEDTLEATMDANPSSEVLEWIIKHRQITKVKGTYLQNLASNTDESNQIRLNFKQTGAATGRFTAPKGDADHGFGGVPIQGIPARDDPKKPAVAHSLRRIFIARPGYIIVKVDYASQELRIASNVSGEQKWIAEYEKERETGEAADLHYLTAAAFYPGLKPSDPDFKLKRGAGKCVHPDTLLHTHLGYSPIQDSVPVSLTADTFFELGLDNTVLVDGNPVTHSYNGGVKPLVHVVSRKGVLTCTEEHRFSLNNGELVRAGDLKPGMALVPVEAPQLEGSPGTSRVMQLWKGVPGARYRLNPKMCYFAGLFLGDGSVNASGSRITHGDVEKLDPFGNPYQEWQDTLYDACCEVGLDPTREEKSLYLGSRVLVRYLSELELVTPRPNTDGGQMKRLRVPSWVLQQGTQGFLSFLGGLIDTDGSVAHQRKTIEYTTKDFVLAGQLLLLAQACNLKATVEATYNKTYERYYARIKFSVESSWALREYLRYAGKIERLGPPQNPSMMAEANEVLKVIPAGEGQCYDITMGTSEHLYRANGLMTHNTANFALVYGGGVGAVQRATGCDKVEGARLKKAFDDSVPQFSAWVKRQHKFVKKHLGVRTAFGRFIAIPDANITAEQVIERAKKAAAAKGKPPPDIPHKVAMMQAKKEQAACERKSTNFPIQGSGADILKISLVMLAKELTLRGWLRGSGDDSVRMIMTVHDEIVFEVLEERIAEALPIILRVMEYPTVIAGWVNKVPLIAEADLGKSWAAKLDWGAMLRGDPKHSPPPYLQGKEIISNPPLLCLGTGDKPDSSGKALLAQPAAEARAEVPQVAAPVVPAKSKVPEGGTGATAAVAPTKPPPAPVAKTSVGNRYAIFTLGQFRITPDTVGAIYRAVEASKAEAVLADKADQLIPVEFRNTMGEVLYSVREGYLAFPEDLQRRLREYNLSHDLEVLGDA